MDGPQNATNGDCGNGGNPDGSAIAGNDPADTSRVVDSGYTVEWLDHLATKFGLDMINSTV